MEEISHVFLRHRPTKLRELGGGLSTRDYVGAQEEEAYGVGAAAIMPWATFFPDLNAGVSVEELSGKYGVSSELVTYRINITGAFNLYRSRQKNRKQRRAV